MIQSKTTPFDLSAPAQSGRMSDHLVRVEHLKALQRANSWDDSELARQCGRKPQQVYAWFSNSRQIGEKLARALEAKLGLTRYALDDRGGIPKVSDKTPAYLAGTRPSESVTKRSRELPIVRWAELKTMLTVENADLRKTSPHLESYAVCSQQAKFVEMPDDSMAPDFARGDHVLLDPTEAPRAGDVVLVNTPEGELFVRMFRPRTALSFEAVPLNAAYQPLTSTADGIEVVAVMVEHRRYRRCI
jgi:SOS-response transcriptional repressor LexA